MMFLTVSSAKPYAYCTRGVPGWGLPAQAAIQRSRASRAEAAAFILAFAADRGEPAVNADPLYRIPLSGLAYHCIAGVAIGNAEAALELTIDAVKARSTNYTGIRMRDFQAVQLRVAAAGARVHAARLMGIQDCVDAQSTAARGAVPSDEEKLRYRRNIAFAVQMCTEAVDTLHAMAGANGMYDGYPIQRLFRDAHALAGHIGFSWDAQGSSWGLVALGGEYENPTL